MSVCCSGYYGAKPACVCGKSKPEFCFQRRINQINVSKSSQVTYLMKAAISPPLNVFFFFSTEHQQYWCHNSNSFHLAYDPKVPLMSAQVSVYYFFLMKSCLRCVMTLMSISALMAAHHSFYINVSHTMCIV